MSRLSFRLLLLVFSGLLGACATGRGPSEPVGKDTSKSFSTVVIDAGHGGKDNGAYRKFGGAEKIATLDVAKRLSRKLRESDLKIVMTRSTDVFIPLEQRVAIENAQKNSIFVSIHFNDSRRTGSQKQSWNSVMVPAFITVREQQSRNRRAKVRALRPRR